MNNTIIRKINEQDHEWIIKILTENWGSPKIITRGKIHEADKYPGFIVEYQNEKIGLITYHIEKNECEITSLKSLKENLGIGTALLNAVKKVATEKNCKRLWLITTNDNFAAIRFYQIRGFHLVAVYRDTITEYRKIKPEIPLYGLESIPIRDEIELEMIL